MKLSEFIEMLNKNTRNGDDPDVYFESYEWTDDLEELQYLDRNFEEIYRKNGKIVIRISR